MKIACRWLHSSSWSQISHSEFLDGRGKYSFSSEAKAEIAVMASSALQKVPLDSQHNVTSILTTLACPDS